VADPDTTTNEETATNNHRAAFDSRITAALVGGVLLGAILVVAAGARSRPSFGGRFEYECTASGSACICSGVFDCFDMGRDGVCTGKDTMSCSDSRCVCF
jgi:hypothetical protein